VVNRRPDSIGQAARVKCVLTLDRLAGLEVAERASVIANGRIVAVRLPEDLCAFEDWWMVTP
jgi:hypothetical protein